MKTRIFLNLVVLLVATASASAVTPLVPDEHTVALWHLDGDGVDASGNGNHLAIKTDRVSWVPGKFSQAALMGDDPWSGSCFNSDGGALTAPGSGCTYPGSGDWTVEAWVQFPSNSKTYYAVIHYSKHWACHEPYHLGVSNGEAFFVIQQSCNEYVHLTADISDYVGQWIHIAGVYQYQQDAALYVNGVQVAYEATALVPEYLPNYNVFLGGCYCGTSTGLIVDEVRLSNVARYGLEPTEPPIADAGDDIIASANEVVTLDGSASYDPDGEIIQYTWKRLPDEVVIYSGEDPNCQTRALGRAEEVIELTVTDNYWATATDTVRIISRTTQDLQDQVAAMQSQIEELQRQIQELKALVDKIVSWPPIRKWLERSTDAED